MPPEGPPGSPPDAADGAGATTGAGAGVAAGAAIVAGAGAVVGVVVAGAVDPDPEPVAPPADGTVTGPVGVGAGTGTGRGAGALLDEPRGGMATGDERTGIEGRGNDPLPASETRSALMALAAQVADGTPTTSGQRVAPEGAPGPYEVGRAVDALVPLVHTELPADGGATGDGPIPPGAGVGGEPTGAVSAGAAISPDQSEAEYVLFGVTFL